MIILNLIGYTLLPVLGVVYLGWRFNTIVTIYFWESAFVGIFLALKLGSYGNPKITEIDDQSRKAMAVMTSLPGFAFYYFFLLTILAVLFFGQFLKQSPAPFQEILPVLIYFLGKNTYAYFRHFIAPAVYKTIQRRDLIVDNVKDVCILMLGVLLGGVVLMIFKDATTPAIMVIMGTVFVFTLLEGIFGFHRTITNLGLYKRFERFLETTSPGRKG